MPIKVEMYISLPYYLVLEDECDFDICLQVDDFELFKFELLWNDEDDTGIFSEGIPGNYSSRIRVEAIYKHVSHERYPKEEGCLIDEGIEHYEINLPMKETKKVFTAVGNVINDVLQYISEKTGMFWVENVSVTPVSLAHDMIINYNFYSPNTRLSRNMIKVKRLTDFYIFDKSITKINDNTFEGYVIGTNRRHKYEKYLNKAKRCLYESNFEDAIVYGSIAAESFIRFYIGNIEPEGDIVFLRLIDAKYDYIDTYYNIVLKYLKGTTLKGISESIYTRLKRMYDLRNAIMHRGEIDTKALIKAGINQLGFKECSEIIKGIDEAIKAIGRL